MQQTASLSLKWAYALVILSAVLPIGLASSGWVALAAGGGASLGIPFLGPVVMLGLGLYRVFLVAKVPSTLDAFDVAGFGKALRKIGIFLLFVGAVVGALNLISRPLLLALPSQYTRGAPVFFVVGVYLSILGGLGLLGLIFFELSRLLGFEQNVRK
jgi:hypothetical protein